MVYGLVCDKGSLSLRRNGCERDDVGVQTRTDIN